MPCLRVYRNIDHPSKKTQWYTTSYLACFLRWGTLTQLSITQGHVGKEKVQPWGIGWDSLPPPIHPLVFRAQCFWPPTKILCHHVSRVADIHRPHDEEEE